MWSINACQWEVSRRRDGGWSRDSSGPARSHRGRRTARMWRGDPGIIPCLTRGCVLRRLVVVWRSSRRSRCSRGGSRRDAAGRFHQGPVLFGPFSSRADDGWVALRGAKLLVFVVADEGFATGAVGTGSLHVGVKVRWS
jgi:hypothetical protein